MNTPLHDKFSNTTRPATASWHHPWLRHLSLLILGAAALLSVLPVQAQSDIDLTGYTLTFEDDFDTLSVTNSNPKGASTWFYWPPYGAAGGYSASQWDINAFSVNNGILSIKAWKDANGNWRSGNLSSMDPSGNGFGQQYGYFAIRCRMPSSGTGAWPAFWMMNQNSILNNVNGTNLPSMEIDIFEWYGTTYTNNQSLIQQASHNWTPSGGPPGLYSPGTQMPGGAFPWEGFHIYGCQVDPEHITWYIDGVQTNQIPTPEGYITTPFYMMVSYALGGGWPLDGMVENSTLDVDWVRVYDLPATNTVTSQDIGNTPLAGSASESGGTYTIQASGGDIWNSTDHFHYVYQTLTGDGQVVARVESLVQTNGWAKAGVMMRDSLNANAKNAMSLVSAAAGMRFQVREQTGANTSSTGNGNSAPQWVSIVREGDLFTGYKSADGINWTQLGSPSTITMGDTIYVGMAVTAHNNTALTTAVIDNFEVSPTFTSADIGNTPLAGSATEENGTFTIQASGGDIWNSTDHFHYVYQTLDGDGEVIARVESLVQTNGWAKAGVMMRESLDSNSKNAMSLCSAAAGMRFQARTATGGNTASSGNGSSAPQWVRLVRAGNTFTGYKSADGLTWTQLGNPETIPMNQTIYVGLAVTSHNNTALTTAVMDQFQVIE